MTRSRKARAEDVDEICGSQVEMLDQWFYPAQQADDPELLALMRAHQQSCDAVLLGRHTFESFSGFWPQQKDDNTGVSDYLNNTHKYVVSSTITEPGWANSTVLGEDAADQVRELKSQAGGDIVLTGSITLAHSLFAAGLVDRVRLFTYPAMQGSGRRLTPEDCSISLQLRESRSFGDVLFAEYGVLR